MEIEYNIKERMSFETFVEQNGLVVSISLISKNMSAHGLFSAVLACRSTNALLCSRNNVCEGVGDTPQEAIEKLSDAVSEEHLKNEVSGDVLIVPILRCSLKSLQKSIDIDTALAKAKQKYNSVTTE